ncbi:hypothetical protein REJC140_03441 [Pseudorhizobium endolithicum]|uniref:Uncharacterized protein n=1 Tax=Pseudorhizobium endolithicum TaxID=1191678 RepID=A0ABM8PKY7_9HYPH|nr:hypothetical protein [Pseudorhizobium endolithicum]CAD7035698.1 hypothetical protein REJC140_03441 [Pseudorhizobium endolithicum]
MNRAAFFASLRGGAMFPHGFTNPLLPAQTLNQPAWIAFRYIFHSEDLLGWIMFFVGILRIVGLIINCAKQNVTSQIRQISAGTGCII